VSYANVAQQLVSSFAKCTSSSDNLVYGKTWLERLVITVDKAAVQVLEEQQRTRDQSSYLS
jgi:hypothetical protein